MLRDDLRLEIECQIISFCNREHTDVCRSIIRVASNYISRFAFGHSIRSTTRFLHTSQFRLSALFFFGSSSSSNQLAPSPLSNNLDTIAPAGYKHIPVATLRSRDASSKRHSSVCTRIDSDSASQKYYRRIRYRILGFYCTSCQIARTVERRRKLLQVLPCLNIGLMSAHKSAI